MQTNEIKRCNSTLAYYNDSGTKHNIPSKLSNENIADQFEEFSFTNYSMLQDAHKRKSESDLVNAKDVQTK